METGLQSLDLNFCGDDPCSPCYTKELRIHCPTILDSTYHARPSRAPWQLGKKPFPSLSLVLCLACHRRMGCLMTIVTTLLVHTQYSINVGVRPADLSSLSSLSWPEPIQCRVVGVGAVRNAHWTSGSASKPG